MVTSLLYQKIIHAFYPKIQITPILNANIKNRGNFIQEYVYNKLIYKDLLFPEYP